MVITIGRKPYNGSTMNNVLHNGCGAINVDETRIGFERTNVLDNAVTDANEKGRFPANCVMSESATKGLPSATEGHWSNCKITGYGKSGGGEETYFGVGSKDESGGTVAKFFFIVKE